MNLEAVRHFRFEPVLQSYTRRDTMLYALGLGYGSDPLDPRQLKFVYEPNLCAAPSICCVLAHPGFWAKRPELEINWLKLLHGEQGFEIHNPIPPEGTVRATYKIDAVADKGKDKGAILHLVKTLTEETSGKPLATVWSVLFLRGDGGCGSFGSFPIDSAPIAEAAPSRTKDVATLPQNALIYRLSGDYNPIHADPEAARKAGFERPILHGLCTLGIATGAVLTTFAKDLPERLKSLSARFSSPVFPGETIRTEFFTMGPEVRFRSRVVERNVIVIDRGTAVLSDWFTSFQS